MRRKQVHVFISGTVQGVSFRAFTQREAHKYGVHGWVRNVEDGRVEAVFSGTEDAVDRLVIWCQRGPLSAQVSGIELQPMGLEAFFGFDVRH